MIHDLILPKMGESITEATVLRWLCREGDQITQDQPILEIATDKVDSEVLATNSGILKKIFFKENDIVPIGAIIAQVDIAGNHNEVESSEEAVNTNNSEDLALSDEVLSELHEVPFLPSDEIIDQQELRMKNAESDITERFYSPLVRTIAREENVSMEELDLVNGSGYEGRVTKSDILNYVKTKKSIPESNRDITPEQNAQSFDITAPGSNEVIEMDRMRKMIADHMVMSKQTSPHVTSFIEVDVTELVNWRNKIKQEFQHTYGQNITYTPIFVDAAIKAIKEYPLINSSLNGYQIIRKKNINIGMATALSTGNLIVPVIKNADTLNLQGLAFAVNDLAARARENKLKPEDVTDGTFTITNLGSFESLTGTPIINQPQLAILALGTIRKQPRVLETKQGDVIAIRHIMILSMAYDHRVIDGFLGGMFLKKMRDILESFDINTLI
ncbi:MAG: dihydrolipoamide acetyltransferase family protein [Saprospiraceae bacterium]